MVESLPCNAGDVGLSPGQWTKIPQDWEQLSPALWSHLVPQLRPQIAKVLKVTSPPLSRRTELECLSNTGPDTQKTPKKCSKRSEGSCFGFPSRSLPRQPLGMGPHLCAPTPVLTAGARPTPAPTARRPGASPHPPPTWNSPPGHELHPPEDANPSRRGGSLRFHSSDQSWHFWNTGPPPVQGKRACRSRGAATGAGLLALHSTHRSGGGGKGKREEEEERGVGGREREGGGKGRKRVGQF